MADATVRRGVMKLLAVTLLLILLTAQAANADGHPEVHAGESSVDVAIRDSDSGTQAVAPTVQAAGHSATTYTAEPQCIRGGGRGDDGFYGCGKQQSCGKGDKGRSYWVWAHLPDGSVEGPTLTCVGAGEEPPPPE